LDTTGKANLQKFRQVFYPREKREGIFFSPDRKKQRPFSKSFYVTRFSKNADPELLKRAPDVTPLALQYRTFVLMLSKEHA
jgi:hypothetical protein